MNKKEVGGHYHQYINPLKTLTEDNIKIHGITNEFLEDKPVFEEIVDDFLKFIQDSSIIAHNANFDIGFLNFELEKISKPKIDKIRVVDTVTIARKRFPGQQVNLDALVNNASSFYNTEIGNLTNANWDGLVGNNLKAPLFLITSWRARAGKLHAGLLAQRGKSTLVQAAARSQ